MSCWSCIFFGVQRPCRAHPLDFVAWQILWGACRHQRSLHIGLGRIWLLVWSVNLIDITWTALWRALLIEELYILIFIWILRRNCIFGQLTWINRRFNTSLTIIMHIVPLKVVMRGTILTIRQWSATLWSTRECLTLCRYSTGRDCLLDVDVTFLDLVTSRLDVVSIDLCDVCQRLVAGACSTHVASRTMLLRRTLTRGWNLTSCGLSRLLAELLRVWIGACWPWRLHVTCSSSARPSLVDLIVWLKKLRGSLWWSLWLRWCLMHWEWLRARLNVEVVDVIVVDDVGNLSPSCWATRLLSTAWVIIVVEANWLLCSVG